MGEIVNFIAKQKASAFEHGQSLAKQIAFAESNSTRRAILAGLVAYLGNYEIEHLRDIVETETQFRGNTNNGQTYIS